MLHLWDLAESTSGPVSSEYPGKKSDGTPENAEQLSPQVLAVTAFAISGNSNAECNVLVAFGGGAVDVHAISKQFTESQPNDVTIVKDYLSAL